MQKSTAAFLNQNKKPQKEQIKGRINKVRLVRANQAKPRHPCCISMEHVANAVICSLVYTAIAQTINCCHAAKRQRKHPDEKQTNLRSDLAASYKHTTIKGRVSDQ
jgi:hypothetical protein